MGEFDGFRKKVAPFLRGEKTIKDREAFKDLLCADCEFYTPREDEDLECGCYRILARLVEAGAVSLEKLNDVLQ